MDIILFLQSSPSSLIIFCGLLGLIVGSFLNVVIYRLPIILENSWSEEQDPNAINLVYPRSHCPQCKKQLRAWQNRPVISYLLLAGKCHDCQHRIALRYPLIELITALLSAYIAWRFSMSLEMLAILILCWGLISLTMIDIDHQLLPDQIIYILLWTGLIFSLFSLFCNSHDAIVGAVLGYSLLWLFTFVFKLITGKQGMGHGDFKLLAVFGAWLGYQQLPFIIITSSVLGSLVGIGLIIFKKHSRDTAIPFGPYLAIAGLIALLWGESLQQSYWQLIGI